MTPAFFADQLCDYAEFIIQRNGPGRFSIAELDALRRAAAMAFNSAEIRNGRPQLDGLHAVEWIKAYRNTHRTTLKEATDEWDRRLQMSVHPSA